MKGLSVALVEPVYPVNIGYIARVMKNFGLQKLILVDPKADLGQAIKFASHGADILETARIVKLSEVFQEFDFIIGTTAIPAKKSSNLTRSAVTPTDLAERSTRVPLDTCLLLGRDTTGLTKNELQRCDLILHVPTGTSYQTMNVSHALAIILYELSKMKQIHLTKTASKLQRERVVKLALRLAPMAGMQQHKVRQLRLSLRNILGRSYCTQREAYLLMGLFRRSIKALDTHVRYC